MNYYNDCDPYCAEWLRNLIAAKLIPNGDVDDRKLQEVEASDLDGYVQCHFFAGIGGWSQALTLADWPIERPVWTGSCPCQPFSPAGKKKRFDDPRHLWPELAHLIGKCRPTIFFGEQTAGATEWLATIRGDLEKLEYAVGAIPIEAKSVGAPHKRDRFWIVAKNMADAQCVRCHHSDEYQPRSSRASAVPRRARGLKTEIFGFASKGNWWHAEPRVARVADGLPKPVGQVRALGNAIVPQVAATLIQAVM